MQHLGPRKWVTLDLQLFSNGRLHSRGWLDMLSLFAIKADREEGYPYPCWGISNNCQTRGGVGEQQHHPDRAGRVPQHRKRNSIKINHCVLGSVFAKGPLLCDRVCLHQGVHLWAAVLAAHLSRQQRSGPWEGVYCLHDWSGVLRRRHDSRLSGRYLLIQGTISYSLLDTFGLCHVHRLLRSHRRLMDVLCNSALHRSHDGRPLQYYRNGYYHRLGLTGGQEEYCEGLSPHRRICSCFRGCVANNNLYHAFWINLLPVFRWMPFGCPCSSSFILERSKSVQERKGGEVIFINFYQRRIYRNECNHFSSLLNGFRLS